MKEPVDHILRPSLPWRLPNEAAVTECGYDATKVKTLTRDEFFVREKELGKQRMAMFTCMTCMDCARRWGRWGDDPRLALQREIEWERGSFYYSRAREKNGTRLLDELIAIERLVEIHREEFSATVAAIEQRRAWNEKKAAITNKPKAARPPSL